MPQGPDVTAIAANAKTTAGTSTDRESRGALIRWGLAVAAVVAALTWAYAPNLASMITTWRTDSDYSHGWLVIPVALIVLWRRPMPVPPASWRSSPWGWGLLIVVLALRSLFSELGDVWLEGGTLFPAIVGLVLMAGGWGLLRWCWPAIGFLVFMYPMPVRFVAMISQPLQSMATVGACALLKAGGLWVMHEGNIIVVGSEQLEVAAACNGLSMLISLAATVVAFILLTPMAPGRRLTLFLSIVPIGLACNVIRIATTAWCYDRYGSKVGGPWAHDIAGWLMMPLAIAMVMAELWLLSWLIADEPTLTSPIRSPAPRKSRS